MNKFIAVALVAPMAAGCALTTASIDVPYQSASAHPTAIPGAAGAALSINATDARTTYRDRVSSKKNGYGMEMAAITASTDITAAVRDAFAQELTARGFTVASGKPASLQVDIVRFYNDFKTGVFSGDAVATVAFNVKITGPAGGAFSKYYEATGTEPNIQVMGADNARAALIKAFSASVAGAVNDDALLKAAVAAGGGAPASKPTS